MNQAPGPVYAIQFKFVIIGFSFDLTGQTLLLVSHGF